jgi:hypothetical protein
MYPMSYHGQHMQIETRRRENFVAAWPCSVSLFSRQWSILGINGHSLSGPDHSSVKLGLRPVDATTVISIAK